MTRLARLKFFLVALTSLMVIAVAIWMVIVPPGSGEPDPAYQLQQFGAGRLTGQALNDALTYALAVQAERNWNHPRYPHWSPAWGEFIEATHPRGVDTPPWETYARNASNFELEVRDPLRRGEPIPARLKLSTRLGAGATFRIAYSTSFELRNGIPLACDRRVREQVVKAGTEGHSPWFALRPSTEVQKQPEEGTQTVKGIIDLSIFDDAISTTAPLARQQLLVFDSYQQLPANQASRSLSYGPAERQLLLGLAPPTIGPAGDARDPGRRMIRFGPIQSPKPIQFSLWARTPTGEWEIFASSEFRPGSALHLIDWRPLELDADKVDVIIRPSETDFSPYNVRAAPADIAPLEIDFPAVPVPHPLTAP